MGLGYNIYLTLLHIKIWLYESAESQREGEVVSQSLILPSPKPDLPNEHYKFCLGVPEWCPCCICDKLNVAENNPDHSSELSEGSLKLLRLKRSCASAKNA